jgi:hypothetical protein
MKYLIINIVRRTLELWEDIPQAAHSPHGRRIQHVRTIFYYENNTTIPTGQLYEINPWPEILEESENCEELIETTSLHAV